MKDRPGDAVSPGRSVFMGDIMLRLSSALRTVNLVHCTASNKAVSPDISGAFFDGVRVKTNSQYSP